MSCYIRRSSKHFMFLFSIIYVLVLHGDLQVQATLGSVSYECNSASFGDTSTYANAVEIILDDILAHASSEQTFKPPGYKNFQLIEGNSYVYGLGFCKDVVYNSCKTCLRDARTVLQTTCGNSAGAKIQTSEPSCFLRYEEYKF